MIAIFEAILSPDDSIGLICMVVIVLMKAIFATALAIPAPSPW